MDEELIETLREMIEAGDRIEYRGVKPKKVYKVLDVFPSSMLWEDEQGESKLIRWSDFIAAKEWKAKNRPRLIKFHDTEQYKENVKMLDDMLKYWDEYYEKHPEELP